jgi:hypothetical protein
MCYVLNNSDLQKDSSIDVFVSSNYHDATLFRLAAVTEPDKIAELADNQPEDGSIEKRARLNSSE